jgi:hypothetical protein
MDGWICGENTSHNPEVHNPSLNYQLSTIN